MSRQLTAEFAAKWKDAYPDGTVTYRDLAAEPLPHLSEETVTAMFVPLSVRTPAQTKACALQETLIAELRAADTVVIGSPMYNLNVPSTLKVWIDHIVIFGRTVGMHVFGDTRLVIASTRGGAYGPGTPHEQSDHQEHYLKDILGMVGIIDVTVCHAEMRAAADGDPSLADYVEFAADSLKAAHAQIALEAARPYEIESLHSDGQ